MNMDFGDFLDKIGTETNSRKQRPAAPVVQEEVYIEKPRKRKREIDYDDYIEPIQEERIREPEEPKSRVDEDFRDGAYDYAQGVIKIIRQNFKTTEERVTMLESINQAVSYYLQSIGGQPASFNAQPTYSTPIKETMSESDWNNIPTSSNGVNSNGMNDLTGQVVKIQPQMAPTGDYKSDLKLGIKMTADGKQEADLSGVTASDINEMKVLAGMIGPEADAKAKELAGARQAIAQQVAEKSSR